MRSVHSFLFMLIRIGSANQSLDKNRLSARRTIQTPCTSVKLWQQQLAPSKIKIFKTHSNVCYEDIKGHNSASFNSEASNNPLATNLCNVIKTHKKWASLCLENSGTITYLNPWDKPQCMKKPENSCDIHVISIWGPWGPLDGCSVVPKQSHNHWKKPLRSVPEIQRSI